MAAPEEFVLVGAAAGLEASAVVGRQVVAQVLELFLGEVATLEALDLGA
jgi:hypothetical protein